MSDRSYIYTISEPKTEAFFMPDGFEANVEIHVWGAGGGDGTGAPGAGGGYAKSIVQINPGDFIEVIVGSQGQTYPSTRIGGPGGTGGFMGFNGGRGGDQGDPEDGDAGSGGGGGAATAVLINGVPVAVGAGGGGGGGYGEDGAGGATPGRPGGESIGAATYTALVVIDPRTGSSDHGYYTRTAGAESSVGTARQYIVRLRGVTVWDSGSPPPTIYQPSTYRGSVYGISAAGSISPSGFGPPNGDNLNAFDLVVNGIDTWNTDTNGQNGRTGGSGGAGGGGGGYPFGGAIGRVWGDDQQGSDGGGGGQNYGNITVAGSGKISGGKSTTYAPASPPYGNAGYPGYAVLVLERKFNVSIKDSSTFKKVTNAYVKIGPKRDSITPVTQTFSRTSDSDSEQTFTVPSGVYSVTITYPTPSGLQTHVQAVTPGERIRVSLGDYGQSTTFGSGFTAPAYSKQVFRYRGNVDHLTSMNIQVVAAPGVELNSTGGNATQESAAATAGLTFAYTYEGWHGDLSSTINITPAPNNTIFTGVRVVAGGGGRAEGPSVTAQPTSPTYVMSGQCYDTAGGEGYYDFNFTLQQRGYLSVQYELPIVVSGWAPIKQIWTKVSGQWKSILSSNSVTSLDATTTVYTSLITNEFVVPSGVTKIYASVIGGGGGGGGTDSPYSGVPGFSGNVVRGTYNVSSGDVITISVGGAGGPGSASTGGGAGYGGSSSLGFNGGRGGNAGGSGWSGGGGGGGAASVLKINGTIIAVGSGGGGGGGGGNRSPGVATKPAYANSTAYYGTAGTDKSGDGGGGGGGGGGFFGGTGGSTVGGDNGAYCGSDGVSLKPAGWTESVAGNQGAAATAGTQGSITISYYIP